MITAEKKELVIKRVGKDEFEKLSRRLHNTVGYYNSDILKSLGDDLASVAVDELMTIVIAKIRAKETEFRELGEKIYNDETREVNARHEKSDRVSERAMALEQLADELEL